MKLVENASRDARLKILINPDQREGDAAKKTTASGLICLFGGSLGWFRNSALHPSIGVKSSGSA